MTLHQSGEDYLEAILMLRQKKGTVRSIDVAQHLGYSKPSISRAMSILKTSGYITMEKDGRLELTAEGEQVAQNIYERHRLLARWLVRLGVSPETAEEDACKIEHNISDETFRCLKQHVERERGSQPK
jgi:Mn-dependent DtxR family transcriptional regulator